MSESLTNLLVSGRYRIGDQLGRGGMGEVYAAVDEQLGREVAIKRMHPYLLSEDELTRRFAREARAVARLSHPNLVSVFDFVVDPDLGPLIVMERLRGATLSSHLETHETLEIEEAIDLGAQLLDGLAHAHENDLIHRDIKPANLFLVPDTTDEHPSPTRLKLVDFGVAHALDQPETALTERGQMIGTLAYMAPEQARGTDTDARSDLYAVGAVLFHCVCGKKPFTADSSAALLERVLAKPPPPVASLRPDAPPHVASVIERALRKNPRDRFADAHAMRRALLGEPAPDDVNTAAAPRLDPPTCVRGESVASTKHPDRVSPTQTKQMSASTGTRVALLVGITTMSLGLWYVGPKWTSRAPKPNPSASASVQASSGQPPPSPAGAAFERGLTAYRAAEWGKAKRLLAEAVRLDPAHGAAHLRLAMLRLRPAPAEARGHYRSAVEHRGRLSDLDVEILNAVAPLFRQPWDLDAAEQSLAKSVARFGGTEAEPRYYLGLAQYSRLHFKQALTSLGGATQLDPSYIAAWLLLGDVESMRGNAKGEIAVYNRCLSANPNAPSCLRARARAYSRRGDCKAMREDLQQVGFAAPKSPRAQRDLADALLATSAPAAAVDTALERAANLTDDDAVADWRAAATRAIAVGDFEAALKALEPWSEATANAVDEYQAGKPLLLKLQTLEEIGREKEAGKLAEEYLDQLESRAEATGGDLSIHFYAYAHRGGAISAAELKTARTQWLSRYRKKWEDAGRATDGDFEWIAWSTAYGAAVRDSADAATALAALPNSEPPALGAGRWVGMDLNLGRTYALTDNAARAVPHLERAAAACIRMERPFIHPTANYYLGMINERAYLGSEPRAAYEAVLAAWGTSKQSRTARLARAGYERSRQVLRRRGNP